MQDTIAALATAPVKGAIGVLRISGEGAAEIAGKVFSGKRRLEDNPRQMLYGDFLKHPEAIPEKMWRSFTVTARLLCSVRF